MRKKEDLRVVKTKKNLYEGLLSLMKDTTFENIRVADICSTSLINRSTFYDHFADKYELLQSLIKDLEYELEEKLEESHSIKNPKDYYMKMIELLFDHISDNISIYSSIIKNNNNSIASDMFKETLLKDVTGQIEKENKYHGDIPIEIVTSFYVNAVVSVGLDYLANPRRYKKEDILNYLDELIPDNLY